MRLHISRSESRAQLQLNSLIAFVMVHECQERTDDLNRRAS